MKSLLTSSLAFVIAGCLFTSCTQKSETSTSASTYDTGDKNVQGERAPIVNETGPRQDQ